MDASGIIYRGWITVTAIPDRSGAFQPIEWLEALSSADRARVQAALQSVENSSQWKRPFTGRIEKVEGSRYPLFELKITRGGARGPQLRFIGFWQGRTFYVAHAFFKKSRRIAQRDLRAAGRAYEIWSIASANRSRGRETD